MSPPPRRAPRARPAFTLMEAVVTMTLIAVIGMAASRVTFQAFDAHRRAAARAELASTAGAALDRIATELRTITQKPSTSPTAPDIASITASSITFTAGASTRTITLTGSNLTLTAETASATLAPNVSAFTVQAYDSVNAALPATPSAAQLLTVRRVQITLTLTLDGMTETLRTKVFLRCLASGSGAT